MVQFAQDHLGASFSMVSSSMKVSPCLESTMQLPTNSDGVSVVSSAKQNTGNSHDIRFILETCSLQLWAHVAAAPLCPTKFQGPSTQSICVVSRWTERNACRPFSTPIFFSTRLLESTLPRELRMRSCLV